MLVPDVTLCVIKPNWLQDWYYGKRAKLNKYQPCNLNVFRLNLLENNALPGSRCDKGIKWNNFLKIKDTICFVISQIGAHLQCLISLNCPDCHRRGSRDVYEWLETWPNGKPHTHEVTLKISYVWLAKEKVTRITILTGNQSETLHGITSGKFNFSHTSRSGRSE